MKYKKKPVVIDAWQYTKDNWQEVIHQLNVSNAEYGLKKDGTIFIMTLEGRHEVSWNDFVIKGVKGEFYPCKPDIFEQTYEKVNE